MREKGFQGRLSGQPVKPEALREDIPHLLTGVDDNPVEIKDKNTRGCPGHHTSYISSPPVTGITAPVT
jgi:hypothetical protein